IYDGCIAVIDAMHGIDQLHEHPEAAQQAAFADAAVISKGDLAGADQVASVERELLRLNPGASRYSMEPVPGLVELLDASSFHRAVASQLQRHVDHASRQARRPPAGLFGHGSSRPAGRGIEPLSTSAHPVTQIVTLTWQERLKRSEVIKAVSQLQACV